jgi:hypothetical protein
MHLFLPLLAGAALIVASVAAAPALPRNGLLASADVEQVHHKPGHQGGPPWLRRNRPGLGHHYGWDRRSDRRDRLRERRRIWRDDFNDRPPRSSYGRWYD